MDAVLAMGLKARRGRFGTDRVESLRRDGLCPSVLWRGGIVDSVLAVRIEGAPREIWDRRSRSLRGGLLGREQVENGGVEEEMEGGGEFVDGDFVGDVGHDIAERTGAVAVAEQLEHVGTEVHF